MSNKKVKLKSVERNVRKKTRLLGQKERILKKVLKNKNHLSRELME